MSGEDVLNKHLSSRGVAWWQTRSMYVVDPEGHIKGDSSTRTPSEEGKDRVSQYGMGNSSLTRMSCTNITYRKGRKEMHM